MELFILFLRCLSVLGVSTLGLLTYMLVRVPTKLSGLFRFALIGNSYMICLAQICLSLGTTPIFMLPCFAIYPNGILLHLGLSPHWQFFIQVYIFDIGAWCIALIGILRAIAVSVNLSKQLKTGITVGFLLFCIFLHSVLFWLHLNTLMITKDEDRLLCSKKFDNNPPPEIFMTKTMVVNIDANNYPIIILFVLAICVFTTICIVTTSYLIWSLKRRAVTTESVKASEDQRKLTINILKLTFFQLSGISFPPLVLLFCAINSIYSPILSMIVTVLLSINPLISCIIMLRLVPAYKKRLSTMCSSVLPMKLIKQISHLKTPTDNSFRSS